MHELEARWTDVFWVEVAPTLGLRSPAPEPSIDELPVLEARVSALEEMEARHGALTLAWSSPGELAPEVPSIWRRSKRMRDVYRPCARCWTVGTTSAP